MVSREAIYDYILCVYNSDNFVYKGCDETKLCNETMKQNLQNDDLYNQVLDVMKEFGLRLVGTDSFGESWGMSKQDMEKMLTEIRTKTPYSCEHFIIDLVKPMLARGDRKIRVKELERLLSEKKTQVPLAYRSRFTHNFGEITANSLGLLRDKKGWYVMDPATLEELMCYQIGVTWGWDAWQREFKRAGERLRALVAMPPVGHL